MKNVFKIQSEADVNQVKIFGDLCKAFGLSVKNEVFTASVGKFISIGTSAKYDVSRGSKLDYYVSKGINPINWDLKEAIKTLNICGITDEVIPDVDEVNTNIPLSFGNIKLRTEGKDVIFSDTSKKKAIRVSKKVIKKMIPFFQNV